MAEKQDSANGAKSLHGDDEVAAFVKAECERLGITESTPDKWRTRTGLLADVRRRVAIGIPIAEAFAQADDAAVATRLAAWLADVGAHLSDPHTPEPDREVLRQQIRIVQRSGGADHDAQFARSENKTSKREAFLDAIRQAARGVRGSTPTPSNSPVGQLPNDPYLEASLELATDMAIREFGWVYPSEGRLLIRKYVREAVLRFFGGDHEGKFTAAALAIKHTSFACKAGALQSAHDRMSKGGKVESIIEGHAIVQRKRSNTTRSVR
jgi:hypothetical protein